MTIPPGRVNVVLRSGEPDYTIEENAAYDFIDTEGKRDLLETMDFDVLYSDRWYKDILIRPLPCNG